MQIKKIIVIIIFLTCIPPALAVEGYGTTTSWINWQGCDQNFEVDVLGHNITHPNTFDYTLEYYLVYINADDVEQTVELETQSFEKALSVGSETSDLFNHFIPSHTLNNWILEVESGDQSETNKTRYVKIVYDSTLTDDGGTHEDHLTTYIWFTGCYAEGTFAEHYANEYTEIGFDINSIGGEGGSGLLADKIGWGDIGNTSGNIKNIFGILFYAFIPILFIMLWLKMSNKVM